MDCNFGGPKFILIRLASDMWQSIQLCYSEQSYNRSPWENDPKYKMVKEILMKPMVLDQGHARLPECEISNI